LVIRLPTMEGLASHCHEMFYNCKRVMGKKEGREGWRWREGMTPKGWISHVLALILALAPYEKLKSCGSSVCSSVSFSFAYFSFYR